MVIALLTAVLALASVPTEDSAREREEAYYRLVTVPSPPGIKLEASGLAALPNKELAVVNRRGELWLIEGAYDETATPVYRLFANGLHEPLGLAWRSNAFYVVQRSELTRIRDTDQDGIADEYLTVAKGWGVTGNYHEYAYGPKFDRQGNAWITLNSTLGKRLVDDAAWRGWSIKVAPDGSWTPISAGMRSPSGLGVNEFDDAFFTDQQGNWVATCTLSHMTPGAFHGHADALKTMAYPLPYFKAPSSLPQDLLIPEAAARIPGFKLPAVWFPYRKMGMSSTDVVMDNTHGRFGPFANQLFVGEFTLSTISRVFLEKVNGEYQGACFPFREGFQCGVLRMEFGVDGSMWVGQSNRGWNSVGPRSYGLQRLVWTGETPFEILAIRARPYGFALEFTQPVSAQFAGNPANYAISSYTYRYHSTYGSPEMDSKRAVIAGIEVDANGREVHLKLDELRAGYVYELNCKAIRSASGKALLHTNAYYTLNAIPGRN